MCKEHTYTHGGTCKRVAIHTFTRKKTMEDNEPHAHYHTSTMCEKVGEKVKHVALLCSAVCMRIIRLLYMIVCIWRKSVVVAAGAAVAAAVKTVVSLRYFIGSIAHIIVICFVCDLPSHSFATTRVSLSLWFWFVFFSTTFFPPNSTCRLLFFLRHVIFV